MRRALAICSLGGLVLAASPGQGQEFFSRPDLDFWGERQAEERTSAGRIEHPSRKLDEREFRWEDYEDPTTEVFWDDGGDYIPPRPLRVAAADPTHDNVARYLRWQSRRLKTVADFQQEIDRQLGTGSSGTEAGRRSPAADAARQAELLADDTDPVDWGALQMVLFYSSTCPHCQASAGVVAELERRGARVLPVQLDWKERPPLFPGSTPYTPEIARVQPVTGVPTWVAVYRGDRISMQGEVSPRSIEVTLKMAQRQKHGSVVEPR